MEITPRTRRTRRVSSRIELASTKASLLDVLDRVLDKGIVVDAWVRLSLVGIDLITVEARIVVASIQMHLSHAPALDTAQSPHEPLAPSVPRVPTRRLHPRPRAHIR